MMELIKAGFPIYNEDKKGYPPFFFGCIYWKDAVFIKFIKLFMYSPMPLNPNYRSSKDDFTTLLHRVMKKCPSEAKLRFLKSIGCEMHDEIINEITYMFKTSKSKKLRLVDKIERIRMIWHIGVYEDKR